MNGKERVMACINCGSCVIFDINHGPTVGCRACGYNQTTNFEGYKGKSFLHQLDKSDLK